MPEQQTLADIEKLAAGYEKAASGLNAVRAELQAELDEVHKRYQRKLTTRITNAAKWKQALVDAVESNPKLFEKPRTQTHAGIKFGLQKAKEVLVVDDAEKTLSKIKTLLQDQTKTLIKTTEKLVDSAVKNLDEKTLKRIGVSKQTGDDLVVVKHASSDVDKLVDAKLAEASAS